MRGWYGLLILVVSALFKVCKCSTEDRHVAVIGAGYSGLAAACELRQLGYRVTVLEQRDQVGGRAHTVTTKDGFVFDAGPSWYWMPEVFERFFSRYGRNVNDFYRLERLDPAYRIISQRTVDVPGTWRGFLDWAAATEPSDGTSVAVMLEEARHKYEKGVFEWIWKPMLHAFDLFDVQLARAAMEFDMFGSLVSHLEKFTQNPVLLTVLKWPVIFIGASPQQAPALYSLMTYAGHALGTWYPSGGMATPAKAMSQLAADLGVEFKLGTEVTSFQLDEPGGQKINAVCIADGSCQDVDAVVAAGDYHHIEQKLLPKHLRRYGEEYWDRQVFSPSCMLYYLGFSRSIEGLLHHTFFFDEDLDEHLEAAFVKHEHTNTPTFYVSATSKTDPTVTPGGTGEALFVLVPMSYRLNGTDTPLFRQKTLDLLLLRMEKALGQPLREHLVYEKHYGPSDFEKEFHAFRGNAFGHANTLSQSLVLKPSMDSLASNMVFAGHLTNPGPGVPPALVSGTVAAQLLDQKLSKGNEEPSLLAQLLKGFILALVAVHVAIFIFIFSSRRRRSYMLCVKLLFLHGRTYFAAATLMNTQRFLDTAAMYGLFRVADDFVDNGDSAEERHANLEKFIRDFWLCWESGEGDFDLHPTLPAIIESAKRHRYPRDLFERFFRSMRMDVGIILCKTFEDTLDYMEGSAAVIGEFMLPVLMPDASDAERKAAMPHARDLGLAFQLTNMIRDINEDIDLNRQYIPQSFCERHRVKLQLRDASLPGFPRLMEELFSVTESYYKSADIGIALLPLDVQDVIRVARMAYHGIHQKIRDQDYDVFAGRARVPFREKLGILVSFVKPAKLARIACVELYAQTVFLASRTTSLLLVGGIVMTNLLYVPSCTYLEFHELFTLPALIFVAFCAVWQVLDRTPQQLRHLKNALFWMLVLCVVATTYTTPWDNFLVAKNVWGYAPNRVRATIGFVPIEEYAFFTLETLLSGFLWLVCFPNAQELHLQQHNLPSSAPFFRKVGFLVLSALFAVGTWLCLFSDQGFYLGLILTWSTPVLLVQWFFGSNVLLLFKSKLLGCVLTAGTFLCIGDKWAIHHGIWWINASFTFPQILVPSLPLEEATFFFMTATMCTSGLTLAMVASKYKDSHQVSLLAAIQYLLSWGFHAEPKKTSLVERKRRKRESVLLKPQTELLADKVERNRLFLLGVFGLVTASSTVLRIPWLLSLFGAFLAVSGVVFRVAFLTSFGSPQSVSAEIVWIAGTCLLSVIILALSSALNWEAVSFLSLALLVVRDSVVHQRHGAQRLVSWVAVLAPLAFQPKVMIHMLEDVFSTRGVYTVTKWVSFCWTLLAFTSVVSVLIGSDSRRSKAFLLTQSAFFLAAPLLMDPSLSMLMLWCLSFSVPHQTTGKDSGRIHGSLPFYTSLQKLGKTS